jgi:hypothetical protein
MANPEFDTLGDAPGDGTASVTVDDVPITWTHTCAAGSILIVMISGNPSGVDMSSVTYDGVVCDQEVVNATISYYVGIWVWFAPSSGSHTVSLTPTVGGGFVQCASVSYLNADLVQPISTQQPIFGTYAEKTGSDIVVPWADVDVVSVPGELAFAFVLRLLTHGAPVDTGADQVSRWAVASYEYAGAEMPGNIDGIATPTWDLVGAPDSTEWQVVGFSIRGNGVPPPYAISFSGV